MTLSLSFSTKESILTKRETC